MKFLSELLLTIIVIFTLAIIYTRICTIQVEVFEELLKTFI